MTKTAWIWIIVIIAVVVLGWVVLASNDDVATTETETSDQGDLSGTVVAPNSLTMEGQSASNRVTASSVFLEAPGFLVIHESKDGAPGKVLGASSLLQAGESRNVSVTLTSPLLDDGEYVAMLHIDNGDGTFSETADPTAKDGDNKNVMMEFEASVNATVETGINP